MMNVSSNFFGETLSGKPIDRFIFPLFPSEEAIPHIVKTSRQLRDEHGLSGKCLSSDSLQVT